MVGLSLTSQWLRSLARNIDEGKMSIDQIEEQFQSWIDQQSLRRQLPEYFEA